MKNNYSYLFQKSCCILLLIRIPEFFILISVSSGIDCGLGLPPF